MSQKMERLVPLLSLVLALMLALVVILISLRWPLPWAAVFGTWALFGRSCVLHWSALTRFRRRLVSTRAWRRIDLMRWWREAGAAPDIFQNFRHAQLACVSLSCGTCIGVALLLCWAPTNSLNLGAWVAFSVYGALAGRMTHMTIGLLEERDD